ncbi:antitoxin [Paenarthrobacter sp. NyZ202]|uniref:antitoxin n=1 Tax=Paenarthrobacter sp. NyZ202 TaxID=3402689 RepID=UPI003CF61F90
MGLFENLQGKAQDLIQGNEEAVQDAIEKVGDLIDEKTGGQFAGQVDLVQDAASDYVANIDGESGQAPMAEEGTQP